MNDPQEIIDRVSALPPLPDTALKLMQVMDDPRSTMDDIVGAIKYDQAVTGEVLRLCNSAYFGLARKVSSLNDAMVCLGTVKVLQLVLSVHTNSLLSRAQGGYGLAPGALWRHSVAVALAASEFAQRIKLPNPGVAFTGGLLHDIGKVVLNEYVGEAFAQIIDHVTEDAMSFAEAEHRVLGFSHEEIGAMIAEKWQLPEAIVRCIRFHHDPGAVEPPDAFVDTVYLANCVCLLLGIGLGEDGLNYRADPAVLQRHGLSEHDLELVGAQMTVELKRVEQIFAGASAAGQSREAVRQ